MAGRKTVPTAIKIANGNPGKRALNKNEPTSDIGFDIPLELIDNEVACEQYVYYATLFSGKGLMKDMFQEEVIQIARLKTRLLKQQRLLEQEDECCIGKNGGGYINPRSSLVTNLMKELVRLLADFGMNPSACAHLFAMTPGAAGIVGKGYAEQRLKQIDLGEAKQDEWQPPIGVTG